jgi:hypothetical protein
MDKKGFLFYWKKESVSTLALETPDIVSVSESNPFAQWRFLFPNPPISGERLGVWIIHW